jgi:ABC-type multidrug transport system fused ATPase/permease subunit
MLGSFICLYCILTLFGTFLIYRDVEDTGCDPSSSGYGSSACSNDGASVFGAMLGVAFAAQGVSQVGSFFEIFTAARVAAYPAMQALRRKVGAPRQKLYVEEEDESAFQDKSVHMDAETGKRLKAVLPAYRIDSRSEEGLKPTSIQGQIEFKDVHFNYPTRPNASVLNGLNLMIEAGKTIALVGPR